MVPDRVVLTLSPPLLLAPSSVKLLSKPILVLSNSFLFLSVPTCSTLFSQIPGPEVSIRIRTHRDNKPLVIALMVISILEIFL